MKKSVIFKVLAVAFIALSGFTEPKIESDFCDGWEAGYKAGYCYQIPHCLEPLPPLCPLPKINEDSYQDGYNRGFLKGKRDR